MIYGRDSALTELRGYEHGVTIIAGDPGVGKSTVLQALQDSPFDGIAPLPYVVKHSPGALAEALAASLAEAAVLQAENETEAEKIGAALADVLQRLLKAGHVLAAEGIGAVFEGVLEQKVGAKGVDVLKRAASEALGREKRLGETIRTAIPPDGIQVLMRLAKQLRDVTGGKPIRLALDRFERLDVDDCRRLMDLVESLPDGISIAACWSVGGAEAGSRIERLRGAGAHLVGLAGLSEQYVAEWLADAGIEQARLGMVMRYTHGYPLWVDAAITQLRTSGDLADLPMNEQIKAINRETYDSLSAVDQTVVSLLAALADPVRRDRIPVYLGISPTVWVTAEARLIQARLLGAEVDGMPWFHELRRRHLWEEILTDRQRSEAATRALREIAETSHAEGAPPAVCLQASVLAHYVASPDDAELAFFATCSKDAVAVGAAMIELSEPSPEDGALGAVNAQMLAMHARSAFGATGDLISVIRQLADAKLIVLVENERAAAAVRTWRSWPATLVLCGRAATELGRYPLQYAASRTFEIAIRPRLGAFRLGVCGIGHLAARELLETRSKMPDIDANGVRIMRRSPRAILVEAENGRLPVSAVAAYMSRSEMDAARIDVGQVDSPFSEQVRITEVLRCPIECIPSRRLLIAAQRITGQTFGTTYSSSISLEPIAGLTFNQVIASQALALEVVRGLSSPVELLALDLRRPIGFMFAVDNSRSFVAEVSGMTGAVEIAMPTAPFGPYSRFELIRQAVLSTDCEVGRVTLSSGRSVYSDGVLTTLVDLHNRAAEFNRYQQPRNVSMHTPSLEALILEAEARLRRDASALKPLMYGAGVQRRQPIGRAIYLLVWRQRLDARPILDEYLMASFASVPSEGEPVARCLVLGETLAQSPWTEHGPAELFKQCFGITDEDLAGASFTETSGRAAIASLLGHLVNEIELPEELEKLRRHASHS